MVPFGKVGKKCKMKKGAGVIGEAEDLIVLEAAIQNLLFAVRTVVPAQRGPLMPAAARCARP